MRLYKVLKKFYSLSVIAFMVLLFPSITFYRGIKNYCISKAPVEVYGIIIDDKNYFGNSPVSKEFSYSYSFNIGCENYKGDSQNENFQIGDSIKIEYCVFFPYFNRTINHNTRKE